MVPKALGSIGIGLAPSGSHKTGKCFNFLLPTLAAVIMSSCSETCTWGGADQGALPSTPPLQKPCPVVAP